MPALLGDIAPAPKRMICNQAQAAITPAGIDRIIGARPARSPVHPVTLRHQRSSRVERMDPPICVVGGFPLLLG
jgi:hypothetical protein